MELRHLLSVSLLLILSCPQGDCISIQEFFPFGSVAGDEVLRLDDDESSLPISLSPPYPILQAQKTTLRQGFIQDFSKRGGNHLTPPTYQETVPITNVLTARIHLWKKL